MAKIILISPQLNLNIELLAQSLAGQRNQVTIITSHGEEPSQQLKNIELLTYFKKWSLFESLRLAPLVFTFHPQIAHFFFEKSQLNRGLLALFTFAKAHPTTKISTSLLSLDASDLRASPFRWVLKNSDLLSCPRLEELAYLRRIKYSKSNQVRFILPPSIEPLALKPHHSENLDPSKILLPSMPDGFQLTESWFQLFAMIREIKDVAIEGPWENWSLRERKLFLQWDSQIQANFQWTFLNLQDPQPSLIWLAGLDLSPSELGYYFNHALKNQLTLVLDQKQSQLHAGFWRHGETCWILPTRNLISAGSQLLKQQNLDLSQNLRNSQADLSRWMDLPFNELTRLYNKALMNI